MLFLSYPGLGEENLPRNPDWTREETILALALYYEIPPRLFDKNTPEVIELSKIINRTPAAVVYKLGNIMAQDANATGVGFKNASMLDKELFAEFVKNPESLFLLREEILRNMKIDYPFEYMLPVPEMELKISDDGKDYKSLQTARRTQFAFRQALLTGYQRKCCLSGIETPELLIASHIKPYAAEDKTNRSDPCNGLLLNALLDRAFDRGLFTIDKEYFVKVSSKIHAPQTKDYLDNYNGLRINLPKNQERWPNKECIDYHNDCIFEKKFDSSIHSDLLFLFP